jgi:hypothetical protein
MPARIAPFLLKYCKLDSSCTRTRYCAQCDLVFFQRRLTEREAQVLYTDYRGPNYNRIRLECEPSYARFIDLFDNRLSTYYTERIRDYLELADVYPELSAIDEILDFGGNGEIPRRVFPGATVFFDDLNAGSTGDDIRKYKMIFASNVFEHISDPVAILTRLAERLAPDGLVFLDVPASAHASLSEGLIWQEKNGGDLFEMHEHITHFSQRSLELLVQASGLIPLASHRLRYPVHVSLAAFNGSPVAEKLLKERLSRTAIFEAKMARAEAKDSHRHSVDAVQLNNRLAQKISSLTDLSVVDLQRELEISRAQLAAIYQSTSWRISAPIRVLKRVITTRRRG